jgi:membrane-associated phospholipid phosphatase
VPAVVLLAAYVLEFYFQNILEHAVHRPDPPTGGGNYPSGGCARLILTYGLLIWFLLRQRRRQVGRAEIVGWSTLLLGAGVLEAYSRTYLLKHWVTDTFGGLVFGLLLLLTLTAAARVLDQPGPLFRRSADELAELPAPTGSLTSTEG